MHLFGWGKRKQSDTAKPPIKALLFDIFGTTMDWQGSLTSYARQLGREASVDADWEGLVKEWRAHYKPAIKPVREGRRPWVGFDQLHREELDKIINDYGAGKLTGRQRDLLTQGWHHLTTWPDVAPALHRLVRQYVIGPLSNGTVRQMIDLARWNNLPWSVVFGADMFRTYKPAPELYRGAVAYLDLRPEQVLMVAAHNEDLKNAASHGLQTCFIHRPTEDSPSGESYDYTFHNFEELATALHAS